MKKFCLIHRFSYDSVCPFCTEDKYRNRDNVKKTSSEKKEQISSEDIAKLIDHFKK